jgi:hypothetical protein
MPEQDVMEQKPVIDQETDQQTTVQPPQKINEEDDFVFGNVKKDVTPAEQKTIEQKLEEKPTDQKPVEKKPTEAKPADQKPTDQKPVEEKLVEEEFFGEAEVAQDIKRAEPGFSYKSFAKDNFDLDIENDNLLDFKTAINKKIDGAKQEFKIDTLAPEAQKLVKHLNENQGSLTDFLKNDKILSYYSFLSMDPEEQYRDVRSLQLENDNTVEDIDEAIDKELEGMTAGQLTKLSNEYRSRVQSLINEEISVITTEKQKFIDIQRQKDQQQALNERENLVDLVKKTDELLGIKLTDKGKQVIIAEINNGRFDQIVDKDQGRAKLNAYFLAKYGDKLKQRMEKPLAEASRQGYNAATDKHQSQLQNTPAEVTAAASGRPAPADKGKHGFDAWKDQSLFDEETGK